MKKVHSLFAIRNARNWPRRRKSGVVPASPPSLNQERHSEALPPGRGEDHAAGFALEQLDIEPLFERIVAVA
jgi:hypothetical protein